MTPNHYESLRVAPGAEDAVIRAAYRALMRLYHPDTNDDPDAQARVRELTAAYAVLRDPEKRAAYDAPRPFGDETGAGDQAGFVADRRARPPMRNFGMASVALAVALSLGFVLRPDSTPMPRPQQLRATATNAKTRPVAATVDLPAIPKNVETAANDAPPVSRAADPGALPPPEIKRDANQSNSHRPLAPRREIAQAEIPRAPVPMPVAAARTPGAASASAVEASCQQGTSGAACTDDRQAQVERMARGFFKQSMEHADWSKQQLLLSARNRSDTSRTLCRSDDCVTGAYLRQIRDTTSIMEGRIPGQ